MEMPRFKIPRDLREILSPCLKIDELCVKMQMLQLKV